MFGIVWDKLVSLRAGHPPWNLGTNSFNERTALHYILARWVKRSPKRIAEIDWYIHPTDISSDLFPILRDRASSMTKFRISNIKGSIGMYSTIYSIFHTLDWSIIQEISIDYSEEGLIEFDLPARCPQLKRICFCARTPKTMEKALNAIVNNTGSLEHLRILFQDELLGQPTRFEKLLPVIEANRANIRTIDLCRIDSAHGGFLPFVRHFKDATDSDPQQAFEIHQQIFGLPYGSIMLQGSNILSLICYFFGKPLYPTVGTAEMALDVFFGALKRFQSGAEVLSSLIYRHDINFIRDREPDTASWIVKAMARLSSEDISESFQNAAAGAVLLSGLQGMNFVQANADHIRKFTSMRCLELTAGRAANHVAPLGLVIRQLFSAPSWCDMVKRNAHDHSRIYRLANALSNLRYFGLFVFVVLHPLFDADQALKHGFNPESALASAWNSMQPAEVPELIQILNFYESKSWKLSTLLYVDGSRLVAALKPLPAKHFARIIAGPETVLSHPSLIAVCLTSYEELIPRLLSFIKLLSGVGEDQLPEETLQLVGRRLWTHGFQTANLGSLQLFNTVRSIMQQFPKSTPKELISWAFAEPDGVPVITPFKFGCSCTEISSVRLQLAQIFKAAILGGWY
jgi:hypothetical protein